MRKLFPFLLIAALLGLIASAALTRLHYRVGAAGFEEKSFCNVSDFWDCDTALASRFSSLKLPFATFPTSELGILYYLAVSLGLLYARAAPNRQSTLLFLFLASALALLYSGWMAYLSFAKLGVLCLFCLATYLANLFLFLFLPRAVPVRYRELPLLLIRYLRAPLGSVEMRPGGLVHLGLTLVVVGVGLLFFLGMNPKIHKAHAEVPRERYLKAFYDLPQREIRLPERPFWGNSVGKVTVVEFSDFQCPFCRRAAFSLKPYLKEYRHNLRFVFLNYPLDSSCNPALEQAMHPVACLAAKAVLCAFRQGRFWEYHDSIFENQRRLSRDTLLRLASGAGLDRSAFEACLVADETASLLREDVDLGNSLEVRGTPALFINGRPFRDWLHPDRLRMVIEEEIRRARPSGEK